ncbi:MAG: hypothetical protein KDB03_11420 [Planctomycetales bacterium]|nr:hypothetical protein [Planctomycetales bacterium]
MKQMSRLALTVCMLVLSGCASSTDLVQVSGSVTVNEKPAAGATVLFHPEDPAAVTASGSVAEDGTFTLVSAMQNGIAPGKYKVTVTWPDASKQPTKEQIMMGTAEPGPDLLKGKYASRDRTSLTAEITPSTTTLNPFEL